MLQAYYWNMKEQLRKSIVRSPLSEKQDFSDVFRVRNRRPEVFCKKQVLVNFAKFTGKHLCKINNRNTIKLCDICSKLTIKTSERLH